MKIQWFEQMGWEVLTKDMDESTQGGFISLNNNVTGKLMYQFQRYVIANNKAYIITATQLPLTDEKSQQLKNELLNTLNSFRIVLD